MPIRAERFTFFSTDTGRCFVNLGMINASELRIGNWIEAPNGDRIIVKNIQEKSINLLIDGDGVAGSYLLENFIGISLTPEILEQCGFSRQSYDEWDAFAYKETPICAHWDGVEWCFKYGYDSDLTFASCEHLHQLQNLIFSLTKEELPFHVKELRV